LSAVRRAEREDRLVAVLRERASRTLMFHQAVTELVGLGPTDMKALDLARAEQQLTAGRLAQITGLSTSATTAVLDRLERRGFVERRRDPHDRRKVVVVATGRHDAELGSIFARVEAFTRGGDGRLRRGPAGFGRRVRGTAQRGRRGADQDGHRAPPAAARLALQVAE